MAKFYGAVGYGETKETRPGVWEEIITEVNYYGDATKIVRRLQSGTGANPDVTTSNVISVLADAFGVQNFFAIRYVNWMGVKWSVTNVDVQAPRLILTLGGVYNGPTGWVTRETV